MTRVKQKKYIGEDMALVCDGRNGSIESLCEKEKVVRATSRELYSLMRALDDAFKKGLLELPEGVE